MKHTRNNVCQRYTKNYTQHGWAAWTLVYVYAQLICSIKVCVPCELLYAVGVATTARQHTQITALGSSKQTRRMAHTLTVVSQHILLQRKHRKVVMMMRLCVTLLDVTGSNGHGTSTMIAS
eukprot:13852-Heterococcus_DN1.PRE.1